jgi:hypothetical protein
MLKLFKCIVGLGLMTFSWYLGKSHFELLLNGKYTNGIVVAVEQTNYTSPDGHSQSSFQPLVTFEVNGKSYRFKNYMGSGNAGATGSTVPVIYNPEDPQIAMIDNGWKNYIPWGPIFLMGFFALLGSIDMRRP